MRFACFQISETSQNRPSLPKQQRGGIQKHIEAHCVELCRGQPRSLAAALKDADGQSFSFERPADGSQLLSVFGSFQIDSIRALWSAKTP